MAESFTDSFEEKLVTLQNRLQAFVEHYTLEGANEIIVMVRTDLDIIDTIPEVLKARAKARGLSKEEQKIVKGFAGAAQKPLQDYYRRLFPKMKQIKRLMVRGLSVALDVHDIESGFILGDAAFKSWIKENLLRQLAAAEGFILERVAAKSPA